MKLCLPRGKALTLLSILLALCVTLLWHSHYVQLYLVQVLIHEDIPGHLNRAKDKLCERYCPTRYDPQLGYPQTTLGGKPGIFVCDTIYRDLADYVVPGWPFTHHLYNRYEGHVTVQSQQVAAACLGRIPIIYSKFENIKDFAVNLAPKLTSGYILISGTSDASNPGANRGLLSSRSLLRWYGINPDLTNSSKFEAVPLGINCYTHERELQEYFKLRQQDGGGSQDIARTTRGGHRPIPDKLLLINFRPETNGIRPRLRKRFCSKPWVHCFLPEGEWRTDPERRQPDGSVTANDRHLYQNWSQYPFWLAPRGIGLDTHRLWEALYVGSIPVVESSPLDPLLEDMKVLVVPTYQALSERLLRRRLVEMDRRTDWTGHQKLFRSYWWRRVEAERSRLLKQTNPNWSEAVDDRNRRRCWAGDTK